MKKDAEAEKLKLEKQESIEKMKVYTEANVEKLMGRTVFDEILMKDEMRKTINENDEVKALYDEYPL